MVSEPVNSGSLACSSTMLIVVVFVSVATWTMKCAFRLRSFMVEGGEGEPGHHLMAESWLQPCVNLPVSVGYRIASTVFIALDCTPEEGVTLAPRNISSLSTGWELFAVLRSWNLLGFRFCHCRERGRVEEVDVNNSWPTNLEGNQPSGTSGFRVPGWSMTGN